MVEINEFTINKLRINQAFLRDWVVNDKSTLF